MERRNPDGITSRSLSWDSRFSYSLYSAARVRAGRARPAAILVAVHGSERDHVRVQSLFRAFADRHDTLVLAPHFPAIVDGHRDPHAYKYLRANGIAYDELVLRMVDEAASHHSMEASRFLLFGFSGGAHFAHRFLYAHPERLAGVVVAAPGSVTLPTVEEDWWLGLGGFSAHFGFEPRIAACLQVPTLLLIGAEDLDTAGIDRTEGSAYWHPRASRLGVSRVDRLRALRDALRALGACVTYRELPGVGHRYEPLVAGAEHFLSELIPGASAPASSSCDN